MDKEFNDIIKPIINNKEVQKMKLYRQHGDVSCFDHCLNVAFYSYKIARLFNLDYVSMTRAALLHDFFLYDWRNNNGILQEGFFDKHAFVHGKIAYQNASKYFKINDKEKDIIINHMWPVTIKPPKYKETFIITLTDKYSTVKEMIALYTKETIIKYIFFRIQVYNMLLVFINIFMERL